MLHIPARSLRAGKKNKKSPVDTGDTFVKMMSPQRFELWTHGLEGRCSIQLSYEPIKNGAEDEIRTRDPRLGKAMLYP